MHSVCLSLSLYASFPSSWLYQAFCSSAQQQSPERAGMFHSPWRERGAGLAQQQKNESLSS